MSAIEINILQRSGYLVFCVSSHFSSMIIILTLQTFLQKLGIARVSSYYDDIMHA